MTTAEGGAPAPTRRRRRHSVDIRGWRPQTQTPSSLARSQRQSAASGHSSWPHDHTLRAIAEEALHPSQSAYIDTLPPLSPHTKYPRTQWGTPSYTRGGPCRSRHQARSPGGRQVGPPPPTFWHARQGEQPTGGQIQPRPAAWPGTGVPYSPGARSPSMAAPPPHPRNGRPPLGAATSQPRTAARERFGSAAPIPVTSGNLSRYHHMHGSPSRARSQTGGVDHNGTHAVARVAASPRHAHWEAVERLFRYSPHTPDPRFAHAEVSSPQKGHPNATAASPWTGAPHRATRPSPSRATTSHRRMAARRRRGVAAPSQPPFWQPHHLVFRPSQQPSRPRTSVATTTTTIIIIETRHTTAAQWPTCSPAPASAREWHFAASPGPRAK